MASRTPNLNLLRSWEIQDRYRALDSQDRQRAGTFDPSLHPHRPKGKDGGQWAPKDGGGGGYAIVADNGTERVTVSVHKSFDAAQRQLGGKKDWRAKGYALSVEKVADDVADAKQIRVTASMLAGHLVDENGDAIGPDETIVVYHATTPEVADQLVANGIEPAAKKSKPATLITDPTVAKMLGKNVGDPLDYEPGRGIGPGTYVSADTVQADTFGPAVVGIRVKVRDLAVPPERPKSDPVKALLNNDGYLTRRIPADDVFLVTRKERQRAGTFDPAKHPHKPKGSGGGQWAATPEPNQPRGPQYAPKPHGYHPARLDYGGPELRGLNADFAANPGDYFPDSGDEAAPPDGALQAIVELQGFDGLPTVVDEALLPIDRWDDRGFKTSEGGGAIELWRGLSEDINGSGDQYAEAFRSGAFRTGQGVHGNGVYLTTDRNLAAAYTYDSQGLTNPSPRGLLHMALRPDARVVVQDATFMADWKAAAANTPLYVDAGRYAAARGFDAMLAPDGNYVLLNRTAVVVAR